MSLVDHILIVRADANSLIGGGHFMRCLALAQEWQSRGGNSIFLTCCTSPGLLTFLKKEKIESTFLQRQYPDQYDLDFTIQNVKLLAHPNAKSIWTALDGYHFDEAYQKSLIDSGVNLLVIDDLANLSRYYANIILNQNISAQDLKYNSDPDTTILRGPRYALLRKEFRKWRDWRRTVPEKAQKILVSLGAGDSQNVIFEVIKGLKLIKQSSFEVRIIVGPAYANKERLVHILYGLPNFSIFDSVADMAEMMAWADLAISAGGSTLWEFATMGLPALVIPMADNQVPTVEILFQMGVIVKIGDPDDLDENQISKKIIHLIEDHSKRKIMSDLGRNLVDGLGTSRVVDEMLRRIS